MGDGKNEYPVFQKLDQCKQILNSNKFAFDHVFEVNNFPIVSTTEKSDIAYNRAASYLTDYQFVILCQPGILEPQLLKRGCLLPVAVIKLYGGPFNAQKIPNGLSFVTSDIENGYELVTSDGSRSLVGEISAADISNVHRNEQNQLEIPIEISENFAQMLARGSSEVVSATIAGVKTVTPPILYDPNITLDVALERVMYKHNNLRFPISTLSLEEVVTAFKDASERRDGDFHTLANGSNLELIHVVYVNGVINQSTIDESKHKGLFNVKGSYMVCDNPHTVDDGDMTDEDGEISALLSPGEGQPLVHNDESLLKTDASFVFATV